MKKILFAVMALCLSIDTASAQAKWITSSDSKPGAVNQWICFRKDFALEKVPEDVVAQIAADSKYWLWINGKLVVFEGQLKRGPRPGESYCDEVGIAKYLHSGKNKIAILLDYFGKSGFSHMDSGQPGLYFSAPSIGLVSGQDWKSRRHPSYSTMEGPVPNYRLPESNISYDARESLRDWQNGYVTGFMPSVELAARDEGPWGKLEMRPIPLWKDFGVKNADFKIISSGDTVVAEATLPYNMQMTPVLKLNSRTAGLKVSIRTDHSFAGSTENVSAEYVTCRGSQSYESLGWMNGEKIILRYPSGVELLSVGYRETGYDTEPSGKFSCDDEFYSRFWSKALRTLYVNMRDTYFDCPDRERAQWWGDEVVLLGECFYTYSTTTHQLMRKGLRELVNWAAPDGALHSPIPGNYDSELPGQMLAAIGKYGLWTYYMNTGDVETVRHCYPAVRKYLSLWTLDETGLTNFRSGGWSWGDWGDNRDMRLIYSGWHIIALDAAADMAELLGFESDASAYRSTAARIRKAYSLCWNGKAYRHPDYKMLTDDRVQALAVLAGVATRNQYPALLDQLKKSEHASPYMEKYVLEALFKMGYGEYAMERGEKRFDTMVNDPVHSTLYEFWELVKDGQATASTSNHAWSGGVLTVIAQNLCGIYPLEAGCKVMAVEPSGIRFSHYDISVPMVTGMLRTRWDKDAAGSIHFRVEVPEGTVAKVRLPWSGQTVECPAGQYSFVN